MEIMNEIIQVALFFGLLIALTPLLGHYMARVFQGGKTFLQPLLGPLEKLVYKLTGVSPDEEMSWKGYFVAVLIFNVLGLLSLWALQMTQFWLPLNPQKLPNVPWDLALNTAISFITNTNWQAYAGETTMSYLTQMTGLAVHNFLSAATGMAVLLAVARGLKRASAKTLGCFWVDLTRSVLYVLLPLSIIVAVILVSQGVVQNFNSYPNANLLETYTTQVQKTDDKGNPVKGADGKPVMQDVTVSTQPIPVGPAASQIAIKQLGTNGGGFYDQNSAHPFENPTPLSNFVELLSMMIVASGLIYAFGLMVGNIGHARVLFGVMLLLLAGAFALAWWAESQPNPVMRNILPNMEGKEQRLGVMNSVLWAVATTGTSCGAVNCMHDSLTPLAGLAPLWNLMLGCIVFGGVGAGLYGILMHVLLTVFIAGLLVGRTPEYLGKKIQAWEAGWSVVGIMIPNMLILFGSAWAVMTATGLSSMNNAGPHGLSEVFYAYASCANNNGSAFASLNGNTLFYNLTLGATMFIGRFGVAFAVLAIAGNLASKKTVPNSGGTLPVGGLTFACALLGVIIIVAALTFFPALCLGPIVEHGLMQAGRTF
jgi:K+-transporting ATPase ATPase A chain